MASFFNPYIEEERIRSLQNTLVPEDEILTYAKWGLFIDPSYNGYLSCLKCRRTIVSKDKIDDCDWALSHLLSSPDCSTANHWYDTAVYDDSYPHISILTDDVLDAIKHLKPLFPPIRKAWFNEEKELLLPFNPSTGTVADRPDEPIYNQYTPEILALIELPTYDEVSSEGFSENGSEGESEYQEVDEDERFRATCHDENDPDFSLEARVQRRLNKNIKPNNELYYSKILSTLSLVKDEVNTSTEEEQPKPIKPDLINSSSSDTSPSLDCFTPFSDLVKNLQLDEPTTSAKALRKERKLMAILFQELPRFDVLKEDAIKFELNDFKKVKRIQPSDFISKLDEYHHLLTYDKTDPWMSTYAVSPFLSDRNRRGVSLRLYNVYRANQLDEKMYLGDGDDEDGDDYILPNPEMIINQKCNSVFKSFIKRLYTFKRWDQFDSPSFIVIAGAGFFAISNRSVHCYYCALGLTFSNAKEDPWELHKTLSPSCKYVRKMGDKLIIPSLFPEEKADSNQMECKVCFENKIKTVLLPCGHVICCKSCAFLTAYHQEECPLCRLPIEFIAPAFF